jgi:chromosome partitioning protein
MVQRVRSKMLAPTARKIAPSFSSAQLAALVGLDKPQLTYRLGKGDLPSGGMNATNTRREFSLVDVQAWVREHRREFLRPKGKRAVTICVGNFKGGVSKTTTAMTLCQALSLKGHRVLAVDTDPQGSLTTLFGILPETEVAEEQTIALVAAGESDSITPAIQKTYWSGIDLVAAAPTLFSAEFALPAQQVKNPGFRFWDVLNLAIDEARDEYDVIVIDTPPALSYITINALMAADGIIVPMPPSSLDFASSAQFWSLFSDIAAQLVEKGGLMKTYEFVHVLLSRVDSSDTVSSVVRQWIASTYAEKVLPVEIPKTAVASATSVEFGTIYDVQRYEGNAKTYRRAREAYDRFAELIQESMLQVWNGSKG